MSDVQQVTVEPTVKEVDGYSRLQPLTISIYNCGEKDFYVTLNGAPVFLGTVPGKGDSFTLKVNNVYLGPSHQT